MPGRKRMGWVTDTWSDIKKIKYIYLFPQCNMFLLNIHRFKFRKGSKTTLILFSGGPLQYSLPTCLLEQNLSTLKHPASPELVKHYMLCQAESDWDG